VTKRDSFGLLKTNKISCQSQSKGGAAFGVETWRRFSGAFSAGIRRVYRL
jgi:hypothetical protein